MLLLQKDWPSFGDCSKKIAVHRRVESIQDPAQDHKVKLAKNFALFGDEC